MKPVILAALVVPAALAAQSPAPVKAFRTIDSLAIDTKRAEVVGDPMLALRSDGSVAVLGRSQRLVYFDSLGKRLWSRSLGQDVYVIDRIGWNGDTIYVVDNYIDQMLLVGANGGVGRVIDSPDMVRPTWKERHSSPAYGVFDVAVRLEDGSLVGSPRKPGRFMFYGQRKPDPTRVTLLRVDHDGIIEHQLANVVNDAKGDQWYILPDGRVVVMRNAPDSLRLSAISPQGDTLFRRVLPHVRMVVNAVGGPDGTLWVTWGTGGDFLRHTAFDAKGEIIGAIDLDTHLRVGAGDAKHLWLWDNRGANKPLFRYTLDPNPAAAGRRK